MKNQFYETRIKFRTFLILICIFVGYFSIIIYLIYLQIFYGKKFKTLANNNFCKIRELHSPRGFILDRTGEKIVDNLLRFRGVLLKESNFLKEELKLSSLEDYFDLPKNFLKKNLKLSRFPIIKSFESMEEVNNWQSTNEEDVLIEEHWQRKNMETSLNHLVGYLRYIQLEEKPIAGLEKKYNEKLEGRLVKHKIYTNTYGEIIGQEYEEKYKQGENLKTTIWLEAQREGARLMKGYKGGISLMNEKGEILVHLSSPYLKVYEKTKKEENYFLDKILRERYSPGSLFKIISSLALLDVGFKQVFCIGYFKLGDRKFHCWKRTGHGKISNIEEALKYSCNCFFFENVVSSNLDKYLERFLYYLKELGFEEKVQNELGEIKSKMIIKKNISQVMMASIGQGTTVSTIIQMCQLISAIFNGKIIESSFTFLKRKKERKINISQNYLEIIKKGLEGTFKEGTCKALQQKGLFLCGKTSTSQVMSLTKNNYKKEHSIFIGAAPEYSLYLCTLIENVGFGAEHAGKVGVKLLKYICENLSKIT